MTKENFNSTHIHRKTERGREKGRGGAETEKQVLASMMRLRASVLTY